MKASYKLTELTNCMSVYKTRTLEALESTQKNMHADFEILLISKIPE